MAMVHKWRFHFYGVISDALENAEHFSIPMDFAPLEKYMDGFVVEYHDVADLPEDVLVDQCMNGDEVEEGWHCIDRQQGIIHIFYDPRVHPNRQRFTIGHEWGHVLQRCDFGFRSDMEAIPDPLERQAIIESVAGHIAAFYLVPHPILMSEVREVQRVYGDPGQLVLRLGLRFEVSEDVIMNSIMNYRPVRQKR